MRRVLAILICLMLILSCSISCAEIKQWTTMKNFKVKTLDRSTFDLYQVLEEKELVLIDLWYIDCIWCPAASASVQLNYEKYKDQVGFLSINPYDNPNAIKLFEESRGFTFPCAKYTGGANWTQWYPWFILIDKEGRILFSDTGYGTPSAVEELLEWGLSLTPEKKEHYAEINLHFNTSGGKKAKTPEEKQKMAYVNGAMYAYNMKKDMSLEIAGEDVKTIVVDNNIETLQTNEMCGEFFIVPEGTGFSVTVVTEKGFKPGKAYLWDANNGYNNDKQYFSKAKREKNKYTFEFKSEEYHNEIYIFESGEWGDIVKDGMMGIRVFDSEASAADYFTECSNKYGYEFKWHIE